MVHEAGRATLPVQQSVLCHRCGSAVWSPQAAFCRRCGLPRLPALGDAEAAAEPNEVAVLRRLHGASDAGRFGPFLPRVADDGTLRLHPRIDPRDELYTLAEVRRAYPGGVGGRDAA